MTYWMHVYAQSDEPVTIEELQECIERNSVKIQAFADQPGGWDEFLLVHDRPDEWSIAHVRREVVRPSSEGMDYLQSDLERMRETRPAAAVRWLEDELAKTKVIYAFRILSGTDIDDGWEPVWSIQDLLCECCEGLLYTEGEGFSNFQGDQITWEFSDAIVGERQMAVLDSVTGLWQRFTMDLGNRAHRLAFQDGRVPAGVKCN